MSYPERRPYATTVAHAGYAARPTPVTPRPPTEALRILTAQIGFDQPRSAAPIGGGSTAGADVASGARPSSSRLPSLLATSSAPAHTRSSTEALLTAPLSNPFSYASASYHSSQQGALNAELRDKAEKLLQRWQAQLQQLEQLLTRHAGDSAMVNANGAGAVGAYMEMYRCTEDLRVPTATLLASRHLNLREGELAEVEAVAAVPLDNIRRCLDALLTSTYPLAPLEPFAEGLAVLDAVAAGLPAADGAAPQTLRLLAADSSELTADAPAGELVAASAPVVCPSTTAVVLHERLHFDPGEYARAELKKNEEPLLEMEERVRAARRAKESAIDAANPIDALRYLHAQVDFSNDLLLLNKTRYQLVRLLDEDVREHRASVAQTLEDAKEAAARLQRRVAELLPRLQQDISSVGQGIRESCDSISALQESSRAEEEKMRANMRDIDAAERVHWQRIQESLAALTTSAQEKARMVAVHMSLSEQRARQILSAEELLKTQRAHHERLEHCATQAAQWQQGSQVYGRYVDAFVPKLLMRVTQLEDEVEDLTHREAQDYARRFELFAYVAEEARAKRAVQADRMRLLQRSYLLDEAARSDTLDPHPAEHHAQRLAEASKELEEVTAYMDYLSGVEADRRKEVEPMLRRVIAYNLTANDSAASNDAALPAALPALADRTSADQPSLAAGADGALLAVDGADSAAPPPPPLTATVTHPYVAAASIGIEHEAAYVEKHRQLNEAELAAQEEKVAGIRRYKADLAVRAHKYKNAEYIHDLLLGNGVNTNEL